MAINRYPWEYPTEEPESNLSDEMEAWLFDLHMMGFGHELPDGVSVPTKVQGWVERVRQIEQQLTGYKRAQATSDMAMEASP